MVPVFNSKQTQAFSTVGILMAILKLLSLTFQNEKQTPDYISIFIFHLNHLHENIKNYWIMAVILQTERV